MNDLAVLIVGGGSGLGALLAAMAVAEGGPPRSASSTSIPRRRRRRCRQRATEACLRPRPNATFRSARAATPPSRRSCPHSAGSIR